MNGYDTLNNRVTKGKFRKWLEENDEYFQRLFGRSDEYAVIDELSELTIGFFVSIAGQGFVVLKDPELFPSIFSPVTEAYCFLLCLQAAYIHFRGVTQHHIKQDMKIGSAVSVKSIIKIIPYLDRPVQIV